MNVGILTLPLYNNYGGILQAYALKTTLEQMGHHTFLLKRYGNTTTWAFYLKKMLGTIGVPRYSGKRYAAITKFVKREFQTSPNLLSHSDFIKSVIKLNLNAIVVGSDQVWRRDFCIGSGMDYFLDLELANIKRISYAASFGIDKWDFTSDETNTIKRCLSSFSGISLREETHIPTLFQHTGFKAQLCLDPTLLLDADQYKQFIKKAPIAENYTFVYWLGSKDELYKHLPKETKIIQIRLDDPKCCSIEDWLTYIYHANDIITDSFHGCVFSLLFHKKLRVFKNYNGGISRLHSLFNIFEMKELIDNSTYHIDYSKFEKLLNIYRTRSIDFIRKSLDGQIH